MIRIIPFGPTTLFTLNNPLEVIIRQNLIHLIVRLSSHCILVGTTLHFQLLMNETNRCATKMIHVPSLATIHTTPKVCMTLMVRHLIHPIYHIIIIIQFVIPIVMFLITIRRINVSHFRNIILYHNQQCHFQHHWQRSY